MKKILVFILALALIMAIPSVAMAYTYNGHATCGNFVWSKNQPINGDTLKDANSYCRLGGSSSSYPESTYDAQTWWYDRDIFNTIVNVHSGDTWYSDSGRYTGEWKEKFIDRHSSTMYVHGTLTSY